MEAAKYINATRVVKTFVDLLRINSPSFDERAVGAHIASVLLRLGLEVTVQEYGESFNLIGYLRGSLRDVPTLILSAHMDTVEPTDGLNFAIEDGIIRTIGNTVLGSDDKSGIAEIIEALEAISGSKVPHGDLEVVFTSAEERGLQGSKNLDYNVLKGRHAIVMDTNGHIGKIVVAAPTHDTYVMAITGRAAHAGIEPEKGTSSIKAASKIISAIPDGRIDAETTANVGKIHGGTANNIVPKETIVEGEVRGHNEAVLEKTKETIFNTARKIARKNQVRINIEEKRQYKGFRFPIDDPFVALLDEAFTESGIQPEHVITGGGSDANIFNASGIQAATLSSGMQKPHTTEEYIHTEDLHRGAVLVAGIIETFAKSVSGEIH